MILENGSMRKYYIAVLISFIFYSCGSDEGISCDKMIYKKNYKICYSYKHKGAKYVSYTLDGKLVNKNNISQRPNFYIEEELDEQYQSKQTDYINSGYDKGHLANDASFDYDLENLYSVYSMANIIPQNSYLNRYTWFKTEELERELAVKLEEIDVFIGVIYKKNTKQIGNKIWVPYAYYKKLFDNLDYEKCFYFRNIKIKNRKNNLKNYEVSCNSKLLDLG
jgi:endonuclease G